MSRRLAGESCSCDAWIPTVGTLGPYPQEARSTHRTGDRGSGRRRTLPSGRVRARERYRCGGLVLVVLSLTMCAQIEDPGSRATSPARPPRIPDGSITVVAAGDISCPSDDSDFEGEDPSECQQHATAALLADADAVLALGDLQYPDGTLRTFELGYDVSWGRYAD